MTKMNLISVMLIIAMLALAGCSSKDEPIDGEQDVQTTEAQVSQDNETVTDTATKPEGDATYLPPVVELDYATGLDDNGFHKDIVAGDFVEVTDLENLLIPAEIHTIPDASVQAEIDGLMTYFITNKQITDSAVVDGDTVNIDYVGSIDGVDFDGGTTGGAGADVTIGVTNYIDDFLQQLIGHTPGESFDIEVTFPEDYGVDTLNGKEAIFAITLNYISEEVLPELTDDFVAENLFDINSWTSVEEMTTGIHDELQTLAIKAYIQTDLLSKMTATSLPDSVLNYQKTLMFNYYQGTANQNGVTLEEFLQGNTEFESVDALYEGNADQIIEVANYSLVVQAIAEDAGITVTDEDLSDYFLKYYGSADYSEFAGAYGIGYLKYTILQEFVLDYLVDSVELL